MHCEEQALALRGAGVRFFFGALRGTGPRATGTEARFFLVRGPVLRDLSLILSILFILAILLQTPSIDIKVLTDLFSWLRLRSIDIQVRWTCSRVLVAAVVRGPVPRERSTVLKQDEQDGQDGAAWACGEKVWKTLMSIASAETR